MMKTMRKQHKTINMMQNVKAVIGGTIIGIFFAVILDNADQLPEPLTAAFVFSVMGYFAIRKLTDSAASEKLVNLAKKFCTENPDFARIGFMLYSNVFGKLEVPAMMVCAGETLEQLKKYKGELTPAQQKDLFVQLHKDSASVIMNDHGQEVVVQNISEVYDMDIFQDLIKNIHA